MSPLVATLVATTGVSLLALAGLVVTSVAPWNESSELRLLSFAAAVLITTGLSALLPEAVEIAGAAPAISACLAAIVVFYLLDRVLERGNGTDHAHHVRPGHASNASILILIGDAVHNFVDGVVIAVAFMVEPALGWTTALSVAAHELPHEIGDYAILVRGGFSRVRAVSFNLLSALAAVIGGLAAFAWRPLAEANLGLLIGAAAGMFLYIAMVNLIPEVQHSSRGRHTVQTVPFVLGLALMLLIGRLLPHEDHGGHDDDPDHSAIPSPIHAAGRMATRG